jgi:hypothetical protein
MNEDYASPSSVTRFRNAAEVALETVVKQVVHPGSGLAADKSRSYPFDKLRVRMTNPSD